MTDTRHALSPRETAALAELHRNPDWIVGSSHDWLFQACQGLERAGLAERTMIAPAAFALTDEGNQEWEARAVPMRCVDCGVDLGRRDLPHAASESYCQPCAAPGTL